MRMSRRSLRRRLHEMGASPSPPADRVFAERVEREVTRGPRTWANREPLAAPSRARWRPLPVAVAGVAMAALVFLVLSVVPADPAERVTFLRPSPTASTSPPTTTTTTTLVPDPIFRPPTTAGGRAPTTNFFAPPTTRSPETTSAPPSTTTTTEGPTATTAPPPTTTTTRPKSTSTTTRDRPATQTLGLSCQPGTADGQAVIGCQWTQSDSPEFAGYRLWRKVGDGSPAVVFRTRDRSVLRFLDHAVEPGRTYAYLVEAVDAGDRVVGASSAVKVVCC